jgi:NADH-quinone oxidoreductase subunit L
MDWTIEHAWLIPLLPVAGCILAGALGPIWLKGRSYWPVLLGVLASWLVAVGLFLAVRQMDHHRFNETHTVYQWVGYNDGDTFFEVSFRIDPLAAVMLLTVLTVSTLVIVYSIGYMRHDGHPEHGYERFFAFMGLFVFSMCVLVLAGNFLLLYLGWEAVGLCSYLLIGFYYGRPAAAAAAKKAFLVNRVGDFGFGLGVLLIFFTFGTLDYKGVFDAVGAWMADPTAVPELTTGRCATIALLLFCGAVGKSAQLPLHVWLPDAMEGPTPVSALIHAATMVTAGVYMVARCGVIFAAGQYVLPVVAAIGAVTALMASLIALAQYDMKRVLAYSTISQLGYMFVALGAHAPSAGIFHLYTHAFFKALLFLGAGSVMHALAGVIDVREFSGLRRRMPWTNATFLIGCLALAGCPLLSGFFSKDQIIHAAFGEHWVLGTLTLITAFLTAVYTGRLYFMAFCGPERLPRGVTPHESPAVMAVPLVLLAIGAIAAGYVGVTRAGPIHRFLEPTLGHAAHHEGGQWVMLASILAFLLGIGLAYYLYVLRPQMPARLAAASPNYYALFHGKFFVDEAYQAAVIGPLEKGAKSCDAVDNQGIDGLVWLVSAIPRGLAYLLRTLQRGAVQGYAVGMALGLAVLLVIVLATG